MSLRFFSTICSSLRFSSSHHLDCISLHAILCAPLSRRSAFLIHYILYLVLFRTFFLFHFYLILQLVIHPLLLSPHPHLILSLLSNSLTFTLVFFFTLLCFSYYPCFLLSPVQSHLLMRPGTFADQVPSMSTSSSGCALLHSTDTHTS